MGTGVIPVPRGKEKRSGGETVPQATGREDIVCGTGGGGEEKGGREGSLPEGARLPEESGGS